MKYTITILLALIVTIPSFSQITTEEDEFTGDINHHTGAFDIPSDNSDLIQSRGFFANLDGTYVFSISVQSEKWQHLSDNVANFLIDSERKQLNSVYKDTDTNTSGTTFILAETLGFVFDEESLINISKADDVRFKIGNNVYTISNNAKRLAGELVSTVNGQ